MGCCVLCQCQREGGREGRRESCLFILRRILCRPFWRLFIRSSIHSSIHSFIHSFIHSVSNNFKGLFILRGAALLFCACCCDRAGRVNMYTHSAREQWPRRAQKRKAARQESGRRERRVPRLLHSSFLLCFVFALSLCLLAAVVVGSWSSWLVCLFVCF